MAIEKLMTDEQTSEALGVARQTLAIWRLRGLGPKFVKVGRSVRYRDQDLLAYIESRVRRSTSDTGGGQ